MKAVLVDIGRPEECQPVTCTRGLADCPVANRPLADVQRQRLAGAGFELMSAASDGAMVLRVRGDAWLSLPAMEYLARAGAPAVMRDIQGELLGWIGGADGAGPGAVELKADKESFRIRYAWDLLRVNEEVVGGVVRDAIDGEVSPAAHVEGRLVLGKGSRILPGVYIEGNVVIGQDCKVGPNCYIRGSTSIGDKCHVGQAVEIKNSILMRNTSIGHLSYCGDSIIGEGVNFGAGTITANFRHDGKSHRSMVRGTLVETGRRKFGSVVGDGVHTGIHTAIYPGRNLWPGVETRPGQIVQRDIMTAERGG